MSLFLTGFVQVLLVGLNTWQLAHEKYVGAVVVAFFISYLWTWNVKKAAFGSHRDRALYATGAAIGALVGIMSASLIYNH